MTGIPIGVALESEHAGQPDGCIRLIVRVNGEQFISLPYADAGVVSYHTKGTLPLVNSDLARIAAELDQQEAEIPDDLDPDNQRRPRLIRAAAYIRLAYAELVEMREMPPVDEPAPIEERIPAPHARAAMHSVDTSARAPAPRRTDARAPLCVLCCGPVDSEHRECVDLNEAIDAIEPADPPDPLAKEWEWADAPAQLRELLLQALHEGCPESVVREATPHYEGRLKELLLAL